METSDLKAYFQLDIVSPPTPNAIRTIGDDPSPSHTIESQTIPRVLMENFSI